MNHFGSACYTHIFNLVNWHQFNFIITFSCFIYFILISCLPFRRFTFLGCWVNVDFGRSRDLKEKITLTQSNLASWILLKEFCRFFDTHIQIRWMEYLWKWLLWKKRLNAIFKIRWSQIFWMENDLRNKTISKVKQKKKKINSEKSSNWNNSTQT